MDIMHISYIADEMGLDFPKPFTLQIDNTAAEIFMRNSAAKTKLKHIDCRQEWVRTLRNKNICVPTHVDSEKNLADLFTKILGKATFEHLRSLIMVRLPAEFRLS